MTQEHITFFQGFLLGMIGLLFLFLFCRTKTDWEKLYEAKQAECEAIREQCKAFARMAMHNTAEKDEPK